MWIAPLRVDTWSLPYDRHQRPCVEEGLEHRRKESEVSAGDPRKSVVEVEAALAFSGDLYCGICGQRCGNLDINTDMHVSAGRHAFASPLRLSSISAALLTIASEAYMASDFWCQRWQMRI
jgi:hypothetical protein